METSERRHQELLASMSNRQRRSDHVYSPGSAAYEERVGLEAIRSSLRVSQVTVTRAPWIASHIGGKHIAPSLHPDLVTAPEDVARELKTVLLVDPDAQVLRAVQHALRLVADVATYSEFPAARARLLARPPDLLVTNLRLQAYNGLHLVYLAAGTCTRCVVYSTDDDLVLAREVQAAGAFYERSKRLTLALPSYVNATLPGRDRRILTLPDPPQPFPVGRRCTDLTDLGHD